MYKMKFYSFYLILVSVLLILLTLYWSLYSKESFVDSNATTIIELIENLPITKIEIECTRYSIKSDQIQLKGITILDNQDGVVEYWKAPHQIYFSNGNLGWVNRKGQIQYIQERKEIYQPSVTEPDKVTLRLNPGVFISSLQLTNREDCCFDLIKKYNVKLYHHEMLLGNKPLYSLGEKGKSVTYILTKAGERGIQGIQGIQGIKGDVGPRGIQGIQGLQGDVGPQGIQGIQGIEGKIGPQGIQGIKGEIGPQGLRGLIGIQGLRGPQGLQGILGPVGSVGPQGIQGPTGPQGPNGPAGPQGIKGPVGSLGPVGPQGQVGPQGIQGILGQPGTQGPEGPQGPRGPRWYE